VRLQPRPDGAIACLRFDLEALAADLLRSPSGLELQGNGFGVALFDIDEVERFDLQHRSGPRQVAPASQSIYRLNLGLFARNEVFVLPGTGYREPDADYAVSFVVPRDTEGLTCVETRHPSDMRDISSVFKNSTNGTW